MSRGYYLDQDDQRGLLEANSRLADIPEGTVLLDEWQRLPSVWDAVRRAVDRDAPPGRFLLTGSATPRPGVDAHSGAGRIVSLRMRPMALHERGAATPTVGLGALLVGTRADIGGESPFTLRGYCDAIAASGFPGITSHADAARRRLLDAYLRRVVDRDLPDQGLAVRRPETLRRWLSAYAAASSTTTAYTKILNTATAGDGSQPAKTTSIAYRDHLTQLWLLDPVPGWSPAGSPFTRLQQAPKHQLADPGLAARLLNLSGALLTQPRGRTWPAPCSSPSRPSACGSQPRPPRPGSVTCAPATATTRWI